MTKKKSVKPDVEVKKIAPRPLGRPSSYKPEYCEELEAHMAIGYSFESFAGKIGVDRDTLYEWRKVHQDFSDAFKRGKMKMLYKDEQTLNMGIDNTIKVNHALMTLKMMNCHKWSSKTEVTEKPLKDKSKEELLKEAEEIIAKERGLSEL
jgi:transposase-like protein